MSARGPELVAVPRVRPAPRAAGAPLRDGRHRRPAATGCWLGAALWLAASPAAAQSLGLGQRLGDPAPRAATTAPEGSEDSAAEDSAAGWPGPQVALHYSYLRVADGWGGGDTNAAGLAVYVQWPVSELRTGLLFELGSRDNVRSSDDLFMRGALEVGVQLTDLADPFVPHISAVVAVGGIVGERFETTVAHPLGGAGLELGASLRLFGTLHLDATFGYLRLEMNGAAYDTFLFRAALGL